MSPAGGLREDQAGTRVYRRSDVVYLNLTNRCPTACVFCVKGAWGMAYHGYDLKLHREPTSRELLDDVETAGPFREAVFCGFGEPTYRLAELLAVGRELRRRRGSHTLPRVRLNSVGLGELIHRRDIVPELATAVDAVSVSLNAADASDWRRLHRPLPEYRDGGFDAVLRFIRRCAEALPETTATAIDLPGTDVESCRALAHSLGARFRLRPVL